MFFHALVRMRVRRLTTRVSSRRLRDRVGMRRTILCNTCRILEQVAIWLGKSYGGMVSRFDAGWFEQAVFHQLKCMGS